METLREGVPFLVGLVVPPFVMLFTRAAWSGQRKFAASFAPAVVLGFLVSLFMGELFLDLPEAIMSVVIDTSLVYTASQLAYRIAWKPLLEARVQAFQSRRAAAAPSERTA
ncbi:MAG: hypothetical protein ACXWQR_17250 [Ktedonobacterales bacterium]